MMLAGTIDQSARSVQLEQQITQDWQTHRKLSKRWAKIMKRRSKIRMQALKHELYNKMTGRRGSRVNKTGTPTPTAHESNKASTPGATPSHAASSKIIALMQPAFARSWCPSS